MEQDRENRKEEAGIRSPQTRNNSRRRPSSSQRPKDQKLPKSTTREQAKGTKDATTKKTQMTGGDSKEDEQRNRQKTRDTEYNQQSKQKKQ